MKTNEIRKQLYINKIDELQNITVDEKIRLIFRKIIKAVDENGDDYEYDRYITVDLPKRYDMYNTQMAKFKLSNQNYHKLINILKYLMMSFFFQ